MDAAGNFSSLLMRNEHGAEGMVQEVDFRFKVFNAFHGWMVTPDCSPITWLQQNRAYKLLCRNPRHRCSSFSAQQ